MEEVPKAQHFYSIATQERLARLLAPREVNYKDGDSAEAAMWDEIYQQRRERHGAGAAPFGKRTY